MINRRISLYFVIFVGLCACSSDDSGGRSENQITSFELIDPTPGRLDRFGSFVDVLPNGNIVVSENNDSSVVTGGGAVHLYNPFTQTLIASIYGDDAEDHLGSNGVTVLDNNNFVIASSGDDVGGIVDVGSVRLIDGATGAQIGGLTGNVANDQLGVRVTTLANNNYVIRSPYDDEGGIVDAGSVRLVDGITGAQIGTTIAGDVTNDWYGADEIITMGNGNYVFVSTVDDEGGIVDAGSVRLVDGTTGEQIGSTLVGDVANDRIGISGITALANNNYVIVSWQDDEGGIVDAGSVRLIDGTTGTQIGSTVAGDVTDDRLGARGITVLANNNYVIVSDYDDEAGIVDAGSVRLIDGTTGAQIGSTVAGDVTDDQLGSHVTVLANNNYVIASPGDDEGGIANVGSVRLMNGSTGVQIGSTLTGDVESDEIGFSVFALANSNYVIGSFVDDEGGIVDAGSVRLIDGTTGKQIGSTLVGDVANDSIGFGGITALGNNNYVVVSSVDNEGGVAVAGSVRLMDGTTGVQIGSSLVGDVAYDYLGSNGVVALDNNNFIVSSQYDQEAGIFDAGSIRLVNGATGAPIGSAIAGDVKNDELGFGSIFILSNNNYVIFSPTDDEDGIINAGSVRLVDGVTGVQIGSTISGIVTNDITDVKITESNSGDYFILSLSTADNNGLFDSGLVQLIAQ